MACPESRNYRGRTQVNSLIFSPLVQTTSILFSGMIAYRELINAGFNVQIFERDDSAGGNWHYTEETPVDAPIPNANIAVGDYTPSLPPGVDLPYEEEYLHGYTERRREHRGPKPVWESLKSNAPAVRHCSLRCFMSKLTLFFVKALATSQHD